MFGEKKKQWVIGGIDRLTNQCFAELAEKRDSITIKEMISRRVKTRTRLITDKWRAYLCLKQHGYKVDQVNHIQNYVDPNDLTINTQKIERAWGSLKKTIPKTTRGTMRSTYIEEFVYRKTFFSKNNAQNFRIVLNDISEFYPGCFLFKND